MATACFTCVIWWPFTVGDTAKKASERCAKHLQKIWRRLAFGYVAQQSDLCDEVQIFPQLLAFLPLVLRLNVHT